MAARRTTEEARAAREAKLDAVHEQLSSAVERLVTGEDWKRALAYAVKFRSRSFNNSILIFEQHMLAHQLGLVPEPFPTLVAGFSQWQQLGRTVIKGQHGYAILAPITGKFASKTPKNPMSWRKLERGEKPMPGETVKTEMIGAKVAHVFDLSQTEGAAVPLPPAPQLLAGEAPTGLRDGLIGQVEAAGFKFLPVPHEGMIHGANGMTNYTDRNVAVRTNMDDAAQVKTIAHELAHILLHDPADEDATKHRGIAEVEAESVALMVGAAHGMDATAYSVPYVAAWATRSDGKEPSAIVAATAEKVRKAAVAILDRLDTVQIGNGTPPGLTRDDPERRTGREGGRTSRRATGRRAGVKRVEPVPVPASEHVSDAGLARGL